MSNKLIEIFKEIRDVPYKIPLSFTEPNNCCSGKNARLLSELRKLGYEARWRVCRFAWGILRLPQEVNSLPHDDLSTHAYLEVKLDREWKIVDATWDSALSDILPVMEWDGISNTKVAVESIEMFSLERSEEIMRSENEKIFFEDMERNGIFYKAFNDWLERVRLLK